MIKKLFITLVFVCSLTNISNSQTSLIKVRINDFSGGMVSNSIPDLIDINQAASMLNVDLDKFGKLTKRKGNDIFLPDVGDNFLRGIGRFDPDISTSYIVIASDTSIARAQVSDTFWTIANPTSPLTSAKDTSFVQANDLLFVLNGFDLTSWYTGSSWIESNGQAQASPPIAKTGAWLRNYLFLAGGTSEPDWVYFSNNLDPTIFTVTDIIKINTGDGQAISKLLQYRLNELIIYKQRSIFVLDITGATPLTDWTVQPISTVIGTDSPRSVVSLGNDHWFLSSEPIAIRSLVRTEFDKILVDYISGPIQDIFDGTNESGFNLNKSFVSEAAAVLFDNKYILAIPSGTSTYNDLVIVYDFARKAWYLITGWYPDDWVVSGNSLYYADATDGRVIQAFTETNADFIQGPGVADSASDPTVGINFQYVSKSLDFDNPENFKRADALEVEFYPTGNYESTVYINLDGKGWASIGSVNLAGQSLTLPVTLPTTLGNAGLARKTFHTQSLGEFKKMQVRVENGASQQDVELQRITTFGDMKQWRRE